MIKDFLIPLLHIIIFLLSLAAIIYSFGIVWRVEKKLDISYKFFLTAIIFFTLSETLVIFDFRLKDWLALTQLALRALFIIFFLAGTLEMRSMLRRLDGEVKDKK